ncbi:hypothetical protein [Larkinella soli]|uniref:hypothetical protein n=1 Tax=Larkinella soli TaxID=1770527 RepID=UPI0013E37BD6|nr:hypothetical protein [Larkinella soli]
MKRFTRQVFGGKAANRPESRKSPFQDRSNHATRPVHYAQIESLPLPSPTQPVSWGCE